MFKAVQLPVVLKECSELWYGFPGDHPAHTWTNFHAGAAKTRVAVVLQKCSELRYLLPGDHPALRSASASQGSNWEP